VHIAQPGDYALTDAGPLALAELEDERVDHVLLFDLGLADEELPGLAVVGRR
jgi:hypothetical protein